MPSYSTKSACTLLILLASLAPGVVAAQTKSPRFETTARVQWNGPVLGPPRAAAVFRNLYRAKRGAIDYRIKGHPSLEQLSDDLNLTRNLPRHPTGELTTQGLLDHHTLLIHLQGNIEVRTEFQDDNSDTVAVTVRHEDREQCLAIANQLLENYTRAMRVNMDDSILMARKFYSDELERYRRKEREMTAARQRL